MTRHKRLEALLFEAGEARNLGELAGKRTQAYEAASAACYARGSARYANRTLDHLAALEQQAITDYLADVPLPEGWREVPNDDKSWYANYGQARWANGWCVVWLFKDGFIGVSGQAPVTDFITVLRHAQAAHERMRQEGQR